ncbi:MAG TPA: SRPBCC family protein [Blastocatellia bacterium]|nr:SRPBCC family protein [Blastocatellia bacterium]
MDNTDKAKQVATAAAGAALAYYGFKKGGAGGAIMGLMGAGLATSNLGSATGILAGPETEVRQSIVVKASPGEAFELWSRFAELPRFMRRLVEVRRTGERTWRWAARAPFGQKVEWDVEVTEYQPARLIAWRSTTPGVPERGEVRFVPTPKGTRVLAVIEYGRLTGPIGALLAAITRNSPKAMLRNDLRRFKQLIEKPPVNAE